MPLTRILLIVLGLALGVSGSRQALVSFRAEIASLTGQRAAARGAAVTANEAALRALKLRPRDYRYLEQAALSEEQLNRPHHALPLWREAIEQRPGWPYAWARLSFWPSIIPISSTVRPRAAFSTKGSSARSAHSPPTSWVMRWCGGARRRCAACGRGPGPKITGAPPQATRGPSARQALRYP